MSDKAEIDYRKILIAYIDYVAECEGTDFLPAKIDSLTSNENAALLRAGAECPDAGSIHKERLLKAANELDPHV